MQADIRTQGLLGAQAQVQINRLLAGRQRQEEIAAGQGTATQGQLVARAGVAQQLVVLPQVQVEVVEKRREYPQHLLLLAGGQAHVQPGGRVGAGGVELVEGQGGKQLALFGATNVVDLQFGLRVE